MFSVPGGGQHLWVQLPDEVDDVTFASRALAAGVVISPGRPWFPADPPGSLVSMIVPMPGVSDWITETLGVQL